MSRPRSTQLLSQAGFIILMILVITVSTGVKTARAQSFDHESYPRLDFDFKSLELDLGLQPQNLRIDGAAKYQLEANVSNADTVTLYAAHMDISNVTVDGAKADFMLHNDSLFVPLSEPSKAGQEYSLSIRYSGNPTFGLLKNAHGTAWTSQLPRSQRHWIPIVDNPHVELKTTFNISVPSGYQVWATGRKTGEEAVNVDVMKYHFSSEKEVPASGLSLAVGKFRQNSTTEGQYPINIAVEQSLSDSVDSQQLLQSARTYIRQVADSLGVEYPFGQLNIVVLNDHSWETKSWGASTVYLYENRGGWRTQLLRGIIGQWFGIYQREAQWSQSGAITLYQTVLQQALADSNKFKRKDMPELSFSTVYDGFGVDVWNRWQQGWQNWKNEPTKNVIAHARDSVLQALPSVITWNDYAEYWYRQSGQPLFDLPEMSVSKDEASEGQEQDSVAYKVIYSLNETDGRLKLTFEATLGVFKELTTISATEVYTNNTESSEVTFTGAQDSVVLQVDPMISTLRLDTPDHPTLFLDEYKPASFLIYELENSESVEKRAEAARKLGYHAENPDLQLAIRDFMSKEITPRVRAGLLSSLADITKGASGTEQTFLDALDSKHQSVRNEALMALQNYRNNTTVLNRLKQVANNTDNHKLFRKATQVLMAITSPDQFRTFVDGVTQQDSAGHQSIYAIQQLANMGAVEDAVAKASIFTQDEYSYEVRRTALNILIQHDHTPSDWLSRAKNLLETADPRIRYFVIEGLARNQNQEITDYLSAYIQDEYDARVHRKIEQVLQ